jgi:hypothetical protein
MNLEKIIRKNLLIEDNKRRDVIRQIVKDIITVFKNNDEGDYYLPEYFEERHMIYMFPGFVDELTVELFLNIDDSIDNFTVDANYYHSEEVIQVLIDYNPENKRTMVYDLIGELNEIVAHEIRHIDQKNKGLYDLDVDEEEDPFKYYTQPHEIDAQIFGFNRLSKLTRRSFEEVVRNWYNTHKDIHRLSDEQSEEVINKLLSFKNKK